MPVTESSRVLVIDDDPDFHYLVDRDLRHHDYCVDHAVNFEEAKGIVRKHGPEVILLDWKLDGEDGLQLIQVLKSMLPLVPVILLTAHSSEEVAVQAIKLGAFNFLPKPVDSSRLLATLKNAVEHHRLCERVSGLDRVGGEDVFEGIIGRTPAIRTVCNAIANVAPTDVSVMIVGESGTGKELVARAIHRRSKRAQGPFVALNMAAMPKELVESLLFGHEKGAFTGAERLRIGACEEAGGGTLFLDEIGEMPLDLQPKLLRFLQERVFRRVGGGTDIESDVRIVSATNRDPLAEVRGGRLRADLYYRLNVMPIHLPPLRDRPDDIPLLALHAVRTYSARHGKQFTDVDEQALDRLTQCPWPGNVRQLFHVIERVIVLNEGPRLTVGMLPPDLEHEVVVERQAPAPQAAAPSGASPESVAASRLGPGIAFTPRTPIIPLADLERRAIEHAMQVHQGNVSRAARDLGVSEATIYRKMKSYHRRSASLSQAQGF